LALTQAITRAVKVPVIASGGYGQPSHLGEVVAAGADAVAVADALHYKRTTLSELRRVAAEAGIPVRQP
jgi:cyclase